LTDSCEYADTAVAVITQMASSRDKNRFIISFAFLFMFIVYFILLKSQDIIKLQNGA
jgi:hypothetical protein